MAERTKVPLPEKAIRAKHILPPVSRATDGVMPGVDLNDSAALQEMDDLEYVERLNKSF